MAGLGHDFSRFTEFRRQLEAVVEENLPGDFASWEADNSTWNGKVKTIDGRLTNPTTSACAWRLFCAYLQGEESFGYADKQKDQPALERLGPALDQAEGALNQLSNFTRNKLSDASFEAVSGIVRVPADMLFHPVADGLPSNTTAWRICSLIALPPRV